MGDFELNRKVALVTGGASGIGRAFVREFVKRGAKGVTVADINSELGNKVVAEINKEHGPNKAIFVKTDVSDINQLEDAFKKTVSEFKYLDILINNAGIFDENNWERMISINLKGVLNGMLLGLEKYFLKYKSGSEGVIVNVASIAGIDPASIMPIYSGIKFAIQGVTRAWGDDSNYENTKTKVIALCPGHTKTDMVDSSLNPSLGRTQFGEAIMQAAANTDSFPIQTSQQLAEASMKIIQKAKSGTVWVGEEGKVYQYIAPGRLQCVNNTL